jgi:DNA-binding MarR family transcriptional regulator
MLLAETMPRAKMLDLVATSLLARSSQLTRSLMRLGSHELSRTEVGLLSTLEGGPRRITELAATEALAQPSVSKLVDRLEERGLVTRQRDSADGRVVMVGISVTGKRQLDAARHEVRSALGASLVELDDADLATLVGAAEVLERLIGMLQ